MQCVHKQGNVYFSPNFPFPNGEQSDKLIILLTKTTKLNELFIFCKTTSRQRFRKKMSGCNKEKAYFFIPKGIDLFHKDTWIILDILRQFTPVEVIQFNFDKKLNCIGKLKENNLQTLINCVKIIEDIPEILLEKII